MNTELSGPCRGASRPKGKRRVGHPAKGRTAGRFHEGEGEAIGGGEPPEHASGTRRRGVEKNAMSKRNRTGAPTGPGSPSELGSGNVETFASSRVCDHCGKGLPAASCGSPTAFLFEDLPGRVPPGTSSARGASLSPMWSGARAVNAWPWTEENYCRRCNFGGTSAPC